MRLGIERRKFRVFLVRGSGKKLKGTSILDKNRKLAEKAGFVVLLWLALLNHINSCKTVTPILPRLQNMPPKNFTNTIYLSRTI